MHSQKSKIFAVIYASASLIHITGMWIQSAFIEVFQLGFCCVSAFGFISTDWKIIKLTFNQNHFFLVSSSLVWFNYIWQKNAIN